MKWTGTQRVIVSAGERRSLWASLLLDALHRDGCTITRGFVHSPPLPADELRYWIVGRVRVGGVALLDAVVEFT